MDSKIEHKAGNFWSVSSTFRTTADAEVRHQARVTLMKMAVEENSPFADRAADALLSEGLHMMRPVPAAVVTA